MAALLSVGNVQAFGVGFRRELPDRSGARPKPRHFGSGSGARCLNDVGLGAKVHR